VSHTIFCLFTKRGSDFPFASGVRQEWDALILGKASTIAPVEVLIPDSPNRKSEPMSSAIPDDLARSGDVPEE
jgi:hypothetical protein